ncbi:MAG TPA: HAMP domain-containing protein, partial [Solirubrobacterales bacterium]
MRSVFRLPDLWPRSLSLRTRLVVLLVALAVVGLAAADFASYRALHNYLYDRVDQQLESAVGPVSTFLAHQAGDGVAAEGFAGPGPGDGGGPAGPGRGGSHLPDTAYGQLRAGGEVVAHTNSNFFGEEVPIPQVPSNLEAATSPETISPVTVGERGGGSEQFRIAAVGFEGGIESIVAVPLGDTNATLSHLIVIELVVSGAILIALGLAAWWLVGVGLRPLRRMGEVAGQIAAGDLSRRVEPDNDRTEVGRLGGSLNAMLVQIEAAFAERAAGERRLRRFLADASHELRTP